MMVAGRFGFDEPGLSGERCPAKAAAHPVATGNGESLVGVAPSGEVGSSCKCPREDP